MTKLFFLILSLSLFIAACEDPAANKPKATTSEPTGNSVSNVPNSTTSATSQSLPISQENSKIAFTGSKVTGKHGGGFGKFNGTIDLVDGKTDASSVSVEIDMNSVFTDTADLTKHLQTGDFFDAAKFPKASFKSTKIVPDAEKGIGNYTVIGDLELRGVKKSVTFPAAITVSDDAVAVSSEFAINRKDFGIVYAGKADDLIRDNVALKLDLRAPRKK
ncbi:MAG: YceI family protein [Pyrinomonadaceae bacterium]